VEKANEYRVPTVPRSVLTTPEQMEVVRPGRVVYQACVASGTP